MAVLKYKDGDEFKRLGIISDGTGIKKMTSEDGKLITVLNNNKTYEIEIDNPKNVKKEEIVIPEKKEYVEQDIELIDVSNYIEDGVQKSYAPSNTELSVLDNILKIDTKGQQFSGFNSTTSTKYWFKIEIPRQEYDQTKFYKFSLKKLNGDYAQIGFRIETSELVEGNTSKVVYSTTGSQIASLNADREYTFNVDGNSILNGNIGLTIYFTIWATTPVNYEGELSLTTTEIKEIIIPEEVINVNNADMLQGKLLSDIYNEMNPLYGKSIYCDGDSIMQGAGGTSFCIQIAENNNMKIENKAVGGSTISRATSIDSQSYVSKTLDEYNHDKCILNHIEDNLLTTDEEGNIIPSKNVEYILLNGGINDLFKSRPVGEINQYYNEGIVYRDGSTTVLIENNEYVVSDVLGSLERICYILTTYYKNTKSLFVLVHRKANSRYTTPQDNLYKKMIEVFKKWGIAYINLAEEITLNSSWGLEYFFEIDGTHPLKETYAKYYVPIITEKLKKL